MLPVVKGLTIFVRIIGYDLNILHTSLCMRAGATWKHNAYNEIYSGNSLKESWTESLYGLLSQLPVSKGVDKSTYKHSMESTQSDINMSLNTCTILRSKHRNCVSFSISRLSFLSLIGRYVFVIVSPSFKWSTSHRNYKSLKISWLK